MNLDDLNFELVVSLPFELDFSETLIDSFACYWVPYLEDHFQVFFKVGSVLVVMTLDFIELSFEKFIFLFRKETLLEEIYLLNVVLDVGVVLWALLFLLVDVFLQVSTLFLIESLHLFKVPLKLLNFDVFNLDLGILFGNISFQKFVSLLSRLVVRKVGLWKRSFWLWFRRSLLFDLSQSFLQAIIVQ